MSLRAYFAASVLTGLNAAMADETTFRALYNISQKNKTTVAEEMAGVAVQQSDALIAALGLLP